MHNRILWRTSTQFATVYYFSFDQLGWASVTVCDATGELSIQSDWGNFAYRWSADPRHLGHPTLTDFLRDRAGIDYLTNKLLVEDNQVHQTLDEDGTLRRIYDRLRDCRADPIRVRGEYGAGHRTVYLDREARGRLGEEARELVRDVVDEGRNFWDVYGEASEELQAVIGYSEPWEILGYRDRRAVEVLRHLILPTFLRHLRGEAPTHGETPWRPVITMEGWSGLSWICRQVERAQAEAVPSPEAAATAAGCP